MAILVFEHSDLSGSDRLGETLRDYGHKLRVLSLHRGDAVPGDLDDVDGIITCGGPQDPLDDSVEWMDSQLQLLRDATAMQLPVVGLCLGSQLLARALGGTVEKMDNGIEFGWHDVELNHIGREDPLHAGMGWTTKQFEYHRYAVTELPPGARLLASSAHCETQAWSVGLRTYGFQYHPEIHRSAIAAWVADEPGVLQEAGLDQAELDRQSDEYFDAFERVTTRLFESIALVLMPVDRRHAGLVKDLHH